jgi:hypothetical protein
MRTTLGSHPSRELLRPANKETGRPKGRPAPTTSSPARGSLAEPRHAMPYRDGGSLHEARRLVSRAARYQTALVQLRGRDGDGLGRSVGVVLRYGEDMPAGVAAVVVHRRAGTAGGQVARRDVFAERTGAGGHGVLGSKPSTTVKVRHRNHERSADASLSTTTYSRVPQETLLGFRHPWPLPARSRTT